MENSFGDCSCGSRLTFKTEFMIAIRLRALTSDVEEVSDGRKVSQDVMTCAFVPATVVSFDGGKIEVPVAGLRDWWRPIICKRINPAISGGFKVVANFPRIFILYSMHSKFLTRIKNSLYDCRNF